MAHENGIIKVDTSTTGVEIADIQAVLESPKNDIGQLVLANDAFDNPLVNKWAKYKPVKQSGLDFSSQMNADFTWKDTATWWKAYNGQCGLTFTTFNSLGTNTMSTSGTFFHDLLAGLLAWGYERPTGGINQYPFRFFDFNYYSHYAPKPVSGVYDNLRISQSGNLTVQLDESRAGEDLGIQLDDLTISSSPVSGWYIGILIWYSNSQGEYTFAFSQNTIGGNGSLNVEFTNMAFYGSKNVKIVPFLSSVRANQGYDPAGTGVFLSCDVEPQTVLIRGAYNPIDPSLEAIWRDTLHVRVKWAGNIINNTGTQISIATLTFTLYEDNVAVGQPDTVTNIVIPVDGVWSDEGTLIFPYTYDPSKTYSVTMTGTTNTGVNINENEEVNAPRNS